jgi:hypothetical protein
MDLPSSNTLPKPLPQPPLPVIGIQNLLSPIVIGVGLLLLLIIIILFKSLGIIVFVVFLFLFIIYKFIEYFFEIDIQTQIKNLMTYNPEIDINIDDEYNTLSNDINPTKISSIPQVFNIPGNHYSYKDAQEICKAYDGKIASYEDVESYYKNGGEFCNYGWSEGQMVLFPTQKSTFDNLQKTATHKWDCGRPGVNGGYIANPNAKFGVNCKARKPPINKEESVLMANSSYYPKNEKDIKMEEDISYWKSHINNILVSPFNQKQWYGF